MTTNQTAENKSKKTESSLELGLVRSWQSQAWWLWLFLPLSGLYGAVTYVRRKLYQKHILSSYKAPVPVLVVGNITVGGSGKTPLIIELVSYLQAQGVRVGVISRGYGGDESLMPQVVSANSRPNEVGDEPCLIVRETGVAMAVSPNRQAAIEKVLQHDSNIQLIIADDGLQHYKLQRDLEWIVVDSARGFGNKQLLPTGFLREPLSRLQEATVIYHQETADTTLQESGHLTMHLKPSDLVPLNQAATVQKTESLFAEKTVYAMSGIGYPQRFFNTLKSLGFEVIEKPMPDHHQFTESDLLSLTDYPVVITSKDAVKIAPLVAENEGLKNIDIWVLPVRATLSKTCYTTLMTQLARLSIQPSTHIESNT